MSRSLSPAAFAALALALAACNQAEAPKPVAQAPAKKAEAPQSQPSQKAKGESPADRDQVDPDGVVRRGEALSKEKPLLVSECVVKADQLNGKSVKVEGTVVNVCVKKGCWFAIRDDASDQTLRITSKGYRFFVPSKATGQRAVIEGDVIVKTMSEAEAKHFAEDGGKDPSLVKGEQKEIQIAAVGLELRAVKK